jgi:hypothetical protein
MTRSFPSVFVTGIAAMFLSQGAAAQVTRADYERALQWRDKVQPGVLHMPEAATWVGTTHRFVYRRTVSGGHEFVMMDADTKQKRPPFDHARLAAAINKADGGKATAVTRPVGAGWLEPSVSVRRRHGRGSCTTCSACSRRSGACRRRGAGSSTQPANEDACPSLSRRLISGASS